jgi:hypothetical protein
MMKNRRDRTGASVKSDAAEDPGNTSFVGPYGADIAPPQVKPEPAVQA